MFLDDTACNLASLNLCKFLREGGATQGTSQREALEGELFEHAGRRRRLWPGGRKLHFDIASFRHAARIWTIVLEISVLMASFPSEEIAQKQLRVPHAGSRLRKPRHAADARRHRLRQAEGGAICGAISAILTGESLRHERRDGARARRRSRATRRTRTHMLRVIRNHRRAAYDPSASSTTKGSPSRRRASRRSTARAISCRRPARPGIWRSNAAKSTASGTRRSPSSRRPARSAW
jgi:ribonucleoside-diphosphate reductase alpha chain